MALQQTRFRKLTFDPSDTGPQNGHEKSFAWAIDHENQENGDWCWAACLRNALTAFGYFASQKEIVARFQTDHHKAPDSSDQRIPAPRDVLDLWRSYGFHCALAQERPLAFKALAKEIAARGPVQIELWKEDDMKNRHLVLILGAQEQAAGAGREVLVGDPAGPKAVWCSYSKMRGENPLPSGFGEWRRTYTGLEFAKGYLRRFFGQPSRYLPGFAPPGEPGNGGEPAAVLPVESQLSFDRVPDPDPPLTHELALATYGYRHYRLRIAANEDEEARREDLRRRLFLFESIQVCRPQRGLDLSADLGKQLRFSRWHHQIHDTDGPRYYAGAFHFPQLGPSLERAWRTVWIGEQWMAKRVHDAIQIMDSSFGDRPETARLVLFRQQGLVTLCLPDSGIHVVVSTPKEQEEILPLLKVMSDGELRGALRKLASAKEALKA